MQWGKKYYADHGNALADKQKQDEWIHEIFSKQKEISENIDSVQPSISDYPGYERISYRLSGKGMIVCSNGDKIYVAVHSAHEDPEIGDISVAWGKKNKLYVNLGHVCGGLINFMSTKAKVPQNAKDFFKRFYSDTDDKKWIRWENTR